MLKGNFLFKSLFFVKRNSFIFIFTIIYISTHAVVQILLHNKTAFAPDEKLYLYIYESLWNHKLNLNDLVGWPTANQYFLHFIYLPVKFLEVLGLESLVSMRIYSSAINFAATIIVYLTYSQIRSTQRKDSRKSQYFLYFSLIPSNILWTSLGLRESFLNLAITLSLIGFIRLHYFPKPSNVGLLFASLSFLTFTKTYSAIILILSVIGTLTIRLIMKRKFEKNWLRLTILCLSPLLVVFSNPGTFEKLNFVSSQVIKSTQSNSEAMAKSPPNPPEGRTILELEAQSKEHEFLLKSLEIAQNARDLSLFRSLEKTPVNCSVESNANFPDVSLASPKSLICGVAYFLLAPNPFFGNKTLMLWLLGFESPFWIALYSSLVYMLVSRKRDTFLGKFEFQLTSIFVGLYVLASTLGESNLGTAVRHRSILILPIIFLIYLVSIDKQKRSTPK